MLKRKQMSFEEKVEALILETHALYINASDPKEKEKRKNQLTRLINGVKDLHNNKKSSKAM